MLHIHEIRERENVVTTSFNFKESGTEFAIPSFVNPVPSSVFTEAVMDKGFNKVEQKFWKRHLHVYRVALDQMGQDDVIWEPYRDAGYEFLGVEALRKAPSDSVSAPGDYSDMAEVLPEGFLERTARIGRVIGWAPQAQILAHKAVGGFVSHCGWNSILESIYFGVPIATWPLFGDQGMNAFEVVKELKLGVEICLDNRMGFCNVRKPEVISAERIEKGIRQVMEKESDVRKKVKEISEISKRASMEGGSSYSHLGRFIGDE
ncbi:hypothetical protein K1719_018166 [Acacia pycnantha]|nr:hypothetical protein K1719_018166 [Acacia pycnantha]